MGILTAVRDERFVFVGLGVVAVAFIGVMHVILEHYRDEVEIPPEQPKAQYITQETEDAVPPKTLDTLASHYNYAIRDTAIKIIAGRAANDPTVIDTLLRGITREDYDERMCNLRTLIYAIEERDVPLDRLSILSTPQAYSSLVRCLELCLHLPGRPNDVLDDPLYDEYHLRDACERRCLMLVSQLVHNHEVKPLVKAKFVEKWLAKQNWGETEGERLYNFKRYLKYKKNRIVDICNLIASTRSGKRALRQAGLVSPDSPTPSREHSGSRIKVILEISMSNEDENGEIRHETIQTELVPRLVEQTAEEQRRRRRHREAIVLNDGMNPLGRDNIIQREHDNNT